MEFLSNYHFPYSILGLNEKVDGFQNEAKTNENLEVYKKILSFIDLTTLNATDSAQKVENMCHKVNEFENSFENLPNVAAICVYPNFVSTVKNNLKAPGVGIASVAAGFPSSQTFMDIKNLESKMAVEAGATDVDIVISLGVFLSGNYQAVFEEIASIKKTVGNAHLKVILETGALADSFKIWEASLIAMEAGADFIKTSTGKMQPAATLEAAVVMCEAIKQFHEKTGRKVGFKPAGGISASNTAVEYYTVVEKMLGEEWLNSKLFRIGASSLANKLLADISVLNSDNETDTDYF